MKKFYINSKEDLNDQELRTGRVSYARIIEKFTNNNIVLCNNIVNIDNSVFDNLDEYPNEVYQYYLCDLGSYDKEQLIECGVIVSYSDMLDLDVILVDHYGTGWGYVMTDVEWTENIDED